MSDQVRVNLLPDEVGQKNAARRTQAAVGAVGLVVVALLGFVYMWQVGQVNDRQAVLEEEQAKAQALRNQVQELSEYRRLADQGEVVNTVISSLLAGEVSFGGVLQDLAAVMPSDTSISSLAVSASADGTGTVSSSGQSLLGHAPGLERLLIALDKVASFDDVFFASSALNEENGTATFSFTFNLTQLILTGRYVDGLPEVMR